MNVLDSDSEDELPPGWEERVTVDGSVFYVNHLLKATQWTHPRTGKKKKVSGSLPYGWERCIDNSNGKVIYVDHNNKRTTYTDPRLAFAIEEKDCVNQFRQRFDANSTALQVLHGQDLSGKTALITGANSGIGFETARSLARHGCNIIFACKHKIKAEEAVAKIKQEKHYPKNKFYVYTNDLASFKSVQTFCEQIKLKFNKLHMIILNAGVFGLQYSKSEDGYETTFQVNYLSHFYMIYLLRELLYSGSRIVILSSESHRFSNLNTDNLNELNLSPNTPSSYWSIQAYNNSKLCNILFARQLAKLLQTKGISVFSCHPGNMVYTNLYNNWWLYRLMFYFVRPFTKSMQQAAASSIFCATAPELTGITGYYINNCYRCEESEAAKSDELSYLLWRISEEMINKASSVKIKISSNYLN